MVAAQPGLQRVHVALEHAEAVSSRHDHVADPGTHPVQDDRPEPLGVDGLVARKDPRSVADDLPPARQHDLGRGQAGGRVGSG